MKGTKLRIVKSLFAFFTIGLIAACTSNQPKEEMKSEPAEESSEVIIEEVDWIVLENGFGHEDHGMVTLTSEVEGDEASSENMKPIKTKPATHPEFQEQIKPIAYLEPSPIEVEVTESIIPLSETETLTAYNSKGKEKGRAHAVGTDEHSACPDEETAA